MKLNCNQCGKEFEGRSDAKTCSDKCRQDLKRNVTHNIVTDRKQQLVTDNGLKEIVVKLEDICTPDELKNYPAYCETKKLQKESLYRLDNNPVSELRKRSIFIPAKYAANK